MAIPSVPGGRVVKALERHGFAVARVAGSHYVMRHPDGRGTTASRDDAKGTLRGILSDVGLSIDELEL
jgi:predicted RNA binding protein YcfA (HicA-like mRNA interferase family)